MSDESQKVVKAHDPYREIGMDQPSLRPQTEKHALHRKLVEALRKTGHIAEDKLGTVADSLGEALGESMFGGGR